MNRVERLALVDHDDAVLSIRAQCHLLRVARSTLYYQPVLSSPDDLAVMRRIDEHDLDYPFHDSRRMAVVLRDDGRVVNRKRFVLVLCGAIARNASPVAVSRVASGNASSQRAYLARRATSPATVSFQRRDRVDPCGSLRCMDLVP
jgi:hypothetical protein